MVYMSDQQTSSVGATIICLAIPVKGTHLTCDTYITLIVFILSP